jgi:hypothetical protein
MTNIQKLRDIYNSFSGYEKHQLQIKRKSFEKQQGIRFLNLESYVNHLAMETLEQRADTESRKETNNLIVRLKN